MCKDIYYANKRNVFIFDADAEKQSEEKGELVLKCRWLDENGQWSSDQYITLDMLQYDEENCKPFIVDADKAYLEKYPEYVVRRKQLEHSREYLLTRLMERQKYEEELEKRKIEERSSLQLEILNDDKSVSRFRSGTKYGYQYEGTIILPAKYTSAEDFHGNKFAQVGFNKKVGFVRKDGKEVVPVEYKTVKVVDEEFGVLLGLYKKIHLWFGDEMIDFLYEHNDKEQDIITKQDGDKIEYIHRSKKYSYYHTGRYYDCYPIRRKSHDGYECFTLFTFLKEKEYCTLWVGNKVYIMSKNGDVIIKGQYSDIKPIGIEQVFIVKDYNTQLWGVIDLQEHIFADFKYSLLIPTNSEYLIARNDNSNLFGLIDYQGREFITPKFKNLIYLNSERFAFREDHLWGICDRVGNIIHEAEYTYIKGVSSGSIMVSILESYLTKWTVNDNIPYYIEENIKLCLVNEKGNIAFTEQDMGLYYVRHSGDLFSILSKDKREIVTYTLSYVKFIDKKTALIKDSEGVPGFFIDDECVFFKECKNIEWLSEDSFKFENVYGNVAIGGYTGPISDFIYCDIENIDSDYYIASQKSQWGWSQSLSYMIIDKKGSVLSEEFSHIGKFKDGLATAVFQGRKGIIDVVGIMQEEVVDKYGEYLLCAKFEYYYFRNNETGFISEEYQCVENLFELFFTVKKRGTNGFKLYSLEENKETDSCFVGITHLNRDLFVAEKQQYFQNVFQLYKKTELISSECYSSISLLNNGYIALQKTIVSDYSTKRKWKIKRNDGSILNEKEYDSIIETNDTSFKVTIDGYEGFVDFNGNAIVEKKLCPNGFVQTHCFADNGLEDADGNVIISIEEQFLL